MELTQPCQSEISPIRRLVLKHPREAFGSDERLDREWASLNYSRRPELGRAIEEFDRLVALLTGFGIQIDYLPEAQGVGLDSLYTRDASVVTREGMVLCNMGKPQRREEPAAEASLFRSLDVPILGAIAGEGRLEGGDVAWLDETTLAVGHGYRTNAEGIRQLRGLLAGCVQEIIEVPLPHWRGPDDVFHLMSFLSPLDTRLACVYSPLLPVPFREDLLRRGFDLVEVPEAEFETMGCNVLTLAPRRCLVLAGNPRTRDLLERAGVEVHEYEGLEISLAGGGGPTCLTRPILRG
jgi:N-dimethylarginine dimethylaminohydrolase